MTIEGRAHEIIEGAFQLLMEEGLPHVSYKRVAEVAGVKRQLVRYYFPNPDDLMIALCDMLADLYREALISGMAARQ